jgi:tRNA dimethylallyltransferase
MLQNGAGFNGGTPGMADWAARLSREAPVLIAGPTASGKSALAAEIAARDGRVIVNADALQVYGCWRVLTARPSPADEAALPHALYGHVARAEGYSAGRWLREVAALLDRPVVIVGGTGLYFAALTEGLAEIPPIPEEVRAEADGLRRAGGAAALLPGVDAETAARIDRANPMRVQRAWEVRRATGRGLAAWQAATPPPLLPPAQAERLVLIPQTPWLDARIAARFGAMLASGAIEEAARARAEGWQPDLPSSRAIGAAELVAHLDGRSSLAEARAAATLATRRYAKRQRTWFRARMGDWQPLPLP